MNDFKEACPGCGICTKACPFLSEFGTPDKILVGQPEASFYCTSCRRCDMVCPLNLSPSAAFMETKERLLREDKAPSAVNKAVKSARGFASVGHKFPFSFYAMTKTAFWPGCGLSANRPRLVHKVRDILSRELRQKVGLVIDCCFDPAFTLGDTDTALNALQKIKKRLQDGGVKTLITGCLNCHKLLSKHLDGIQVVFILEVLPASVFKQQKQNLLFLHHPCPSSQWEGIRNAARNAAGCGHPSNESSKVEASAPLCCGAGGNLNAIFPELADQFLSRIISDAAGKTVLTYCTGCQNRFLKQGLGAVHLLEYLADTPPRRSVPSPLRQWINRLMLATQLRLRSPKGLILLMITLLIAGGIYLNSQHIFSAEALANLLNRYPVLAPVIFLGIYAVAPALFLPSIPLTLAAGFFWGLSGESSFPSPARLSGPACLFFYRAIFFKI